MCVLRIQHLDVTAKRWLVPWRTATPTPWVRSEVLDCKLSRSVWLLGHLYSWFDLNPRPGKEEDTWSGVGEDDYFQNLQCLFDAMWSVQVLSTMSKKSKHIGMMKLDKDNFIIRSAMERKFAGAKGLDLKPIPVFASKFALFHFICFCLRLQQRVLQH